MILLLLIGIGVGILSGFFGIGGGTILVPALLLAGFEIKVAIGISIIQMLFASLYGSYLNSKKGTLDVEMVLFIGFGGFLGALFSGYVADFVSSKTLEIIFVAFVLFALFRLFFQTQEPKIQKQFSKVVLLFIGMPIGLFSMLIGVGGSILLVPILVGFLGVDLKKATSAGLFFVIFSSLSGLISHTMHGHVDFFNGGVVGVASLFGVYVGIHLKHKASNKLSKQLLLLFYLSVIIYLSYRIFFGDMS